VFKIVAAIVLLGLGLATQAGAVQSTQALQVARATWTPGPVVSPTPTATPAPQVVADNHHNYRVVFVSVETDTLGVDRATELRLVEEAFQFWQDHSPITTTFSLSDTAWVTSTNPITDVSSWPVTSGDDVLVWVVEQTSRFYNKYEGLGGGGVVWVVGGDSDRFRGVVAHEIGHAVYTLDHALTEPWDIMGVEPQWAIQRNFLGCTTMGKLGRPCLHTYVPIAEIEANE